MVDGRLVTAQNPQSSLEVVDFMMLKIKIFLPLISYRSIQVALRMLDVLRSLGDDFSSPLNVNKPWGK